MTCKCKDQKAVFAGQSGSLNRAGWETQMLLPDGQRGGGEQSTVLTAKGEGVVLVIPLFNASRFAGFRVEMIDEIADPPRTPWRSSVIRAGNDETISILVPQRT